MAGPGSGAASNSTAAAGKGEAHAIDQDRENENLSFYLLIICGSLAVALIIWRLYSVIVKYVRQVSCLNSDTQYFFAKASGKVSWLKKNLVYAPISRKRHNREIQMTAAVNIGTLPTRMQLVMLFGYFATNVAFCVINIDFKSNFPDFASQLRNRSGVLSVINMIPLFIMAGRNNPLISWLNVSFDTFNLIHRWLGRIVILEAVTHTVAFWAGNAAKNGWSGALETTFRVLYMRWGFIATAAFVVIGIQAMSPVRHAAYETFKIVHILLAVLAILGLWYHLDLKKLPQLKYMYAVIAIWILDRVARNLRILYRHVGAGGSKTLVEALPGNAVRVTVQMARPWTFKPGQHAYLYFPSISWWQSHPFSVAWSDDSENPDSEKLLMNRQDVLASRNKTSMSFVIRGRTGATGALYRKAAEQRDGKMLITCLAEGPYGGLHNLQSYGTVVLFAGGVGVTQSVPHVRDLVIGYNNGTVAARKVLLVWIVQSPEHLEWIRPWMTEILAMDNRRDVLRIMLFISRPRSTKEIHSPSATVQMFPGRPNIDTLIGNEMESQVGAMAVTVCGPGALSDEVRQAVRKKQYGGHIDFMEEAFSW